MNLQNENSALKIFLADDDEDDVQLFKEALSTNFPHYNLMCAFNGNDCLSKIKKSEFSPDVIFLDMNMPMKNGQECLKNINEDAALQDIPVVIYSTSYNLKDIEACYKLGAKYYLVKPDSFSLMVGMIKDVFGKLKNENNSNSTTPKEDFVLGLQHKARHDGKSYNRVF